MWARMTSSTFAEMTTSTSFKDLLHAENLRHLTDEFTSSPKAGRSAEEFLAFKSPTASDGYETTKFSTKAQPATPSPPKPQNNPYDV
jgi:hypothetical protein